MILISSEGRKGINLLYPGVFQLKKGKIRAFEWDKYRKLAPWFALTNLVFCIVFFISLRLKIEQNLEHLYSYSTAAQALYTVVRIRYGRTTVELSLSKNTTMSVAPVFVWLDYTSSGAMFFLMAEAGLKLIDDNLLTLALQSIQVIFLIYALLPFLNYLGFKRQQSQPKNFSKSI